MHFYDIGEDPVGNQDALEIPELHMGSDEAIVLDKMYGPLIFAGLRITAAQKSCEWVIERDTGPHGYQEWCRIPGQIAIDHSFPWEWNPHMIVGGQETIDQVKRED
jgi:hypothetical protein